MNKCLVIEWNKVIGKNDKVFHLGDVSFANKEKTKSIIKQLNGHKILILGNHDRKNSINWWLDVGFKEVIKYPILYKGFLLSHEPIKNSKLTNIHGHIHGRECDYKLENHINVCIDRRDYQPTLFDIAAIV